MSSSSTVDLNPDPMLNVPITPELIKKHGLTDEEYQRVIDILGREPNLTELGIFSVMWSEHCSYKNSKPLLRLFPTVKKDQQAQGQVLIKAGEENAGVVDIGDGWAICFKIESHNHPSAVEPFEGAATGVGGIIRDIFTMGARPVLLTNSLRFGELESETVKRLFRGVVHGISHYGNCIGIPNVGGDVYFDSCYEGNPLVNALCLGLVKHNDIKRGAASGIGNPVFYVGPATGRDGLGGAAFASKDLSEESAADRPAVQKGDPFMEKLLIEACLEMMAVPGLVVGIQDMGAAGLTCSTCETASRGKTGVEIDLDLVPQREPNMNSYEIMLSESQERMLVIVQKGRESEIKAIFDKYDLPAVEIGEVKDGEEMVVRQKGAVVARINADALAEAAPVYYRESKEPAYLKGVQAWKSSDIADLDAAGAKAALPKLLSHPTIANKRWVYRQYDHMVQAGTTVAPGSDAGVVRVRLDDGKEKFIAIANDCNNRYTYSNPRKGGLIAMVECIRNLACSGARPLGMTDNLNFGNPHKPENFFCMSEAVKGLAEACEYFDVPCVGGNVSLYNENPTGAIDPTPVVSIAGIIDEEAHITTQYVKSEGEVLVLLGGLPNELGASYFLKVIHDLKTGDAPDISLETEKRLHDTLLQLIRHDCVKAAHDIAEGGLMTTIAEMLFGAKGECYGADISLELADGQRVDESLFGESQSRVVIATSEDKLAATEAHLAESGVPYLVLGRTNRTGELSVHETNGKFAIEWAVGDLYSKWMSAIPALMERS